jgi:S-formylglutathione hydrolase FrmB
VLRPDNPASGVAHNFLYVLPVEPEGGTLFGDGLEALRRLNVHNQYNVTLIAPSFPIDPWYADHPTDPNYKFESFMSLEIQPWVTANLASSGSEQHWLLGFSKSGIGGLDLLFKHPDLFTLGAFWDFPASSMTAYDHFGSSSANNYGTDENFQANYRLTSTFVDRYKTPFLIHNRIWISGYHAFQQDVIDFDTLLTATGIAHTFGAPDPNPPHTWDGGWVPQAVEGLYQNSIDLGHQ